MPYASRKDFEDATVALCLEGLDKTFREELERAGKGDRWGGGWRESQSRFLCGDRDDVPEPEEGDDEEVLAAKQQARLRQQAKVASREQRRAQEKHAGEVYAQVRAALRAFSEWAAIAEVTGCDGRWPEHTMIQVLGPALLPLAKHQFLSDSTAESLSNIGQTRAQMSPRKRLIFELDWPFTHAPSTRFNAFGLNRFATPREMAWVLLSARHFPKEIDLATDTPERLIIKITSEMTTERKRVWRSATEGKHDGPWREDG